MQPISFSIPYDLDETNPRFDGLKTLIEMYRKEGETLFAYIKEEASSIRKQITEANKAVVAQIEWAWRVEGAGNPPHSMSYQIIATPLLDRVPITNEALLKLLHLDSGKTECYGFIFRIINNVIVTNGGGWIMHYIENGTVVSDEEREMFENGVVPDRFRAFGHAPKS